MKLISSSALTAFVSLTALALGSSTPVLALDPYQAIIGTKTWTVNSMSSWDATLLCPDPSNRVSYTIGQDVEYRLMRPSVVDTSKNGTYQSDAVCYAPKPFGGTLYGYGGTGDDEMWDHGIDMNRSFGVDYDVWEFNQLVRRGYTTDHYVYYGESSGIGVILISEWRRMRISEFISKVDAGEISLVSPGPYKIVISPLMGRSVLRGGDGNDVMKSRGGRSVIYGENGNDIIDAYFEKYYDYARMVGDSASSAEWSASEFYGGPGDDVYYMRDSLDKFIEYPGEGFDIAFCPSYYENNPDYYLGRDGYSFSYETDIEVIAGPCVNLPLNFSGRHFPKLYMQPNEVIALNGKGTSLSEAIRYYEASLTMDAGAGNDLVVTGGGSDNIAGGTGDDIIATNSGNDKVAAGDGNDLVIGGSGEGNDTYNGGNGTDTVRYTSAKAGITVNLSAKTNQAFSTAGNDAAKIGVDQLALIENVIAGEYGDVIVGSKSANRLEGKDGRDNIRGEAGNDVLVGGKGGDTLTGGAGTDVFVYTDVADSGLLPETMDVIVDFSATGEKINLSAIDASSVLGRNNAFLFNGAAPIGASPQGEVSVVKVDKPGNTNDYTLIYIDTDADTDAEMAIRVNKLPKLTIKNFVL